MGDAVIAYGNFLQAIVQFLCIAFCVFLVVKAMNKVMPKKEEPAPADPEPTKEEQLLAEIRDLLKK